MQYVRAKTNDGRTIADFMLSVMADTNRKLDQRMEAATWLADRGFGKPSQVIEHGGAWTLTDRPAPPPRDDAPAGSEQRRTASQAAPRDRRHAGRAILRPEAGTGSRHPRCQPQVAAALQRCFTNPKTILDCMRLLARLTGELP